MKKIVEELVKLGWKIDEEYAEEIFYKDYEPGENGLPPARLAVVEYDEEREGFCCLYVLEEICFLGLDYCRNNPLGGAKKIEQTFNLLFEIKNDA